MNSRHEQEEYLEQDDEERESSSRRTSLIALLIIAGLVAAGLMLVNRLHSVSALQDCLMTRSAHCADVTPDTPR